jgi:hypothetical protein
MMQELGKLCSLMLHSCVFCYRLTATQMSSREKSISAAIDATSKRSSFCIANILCQLNQINDDFLFPVLDKIDIQVKMLINWWTKRNK